jgi:succinate-acetate transporter protein
MQETPGSQPYRIVLRPIANPLPIGLLALLIASVSVSALQLGWIPPGESVAVGRIVVVLALTVQLPGAAFGFLARDPAAGTAMALLGGTWLAVGLTMALSPAGSTSAALGIALLAAAVALLVPISVALAKPVTMVVLSVASVRFAVTGVVQLGAPPVWETVAGVVGIVLGVLALYAAMAFELEDVHHRTILPLGRTGPAHAAMESGMDEQLRGIEQEAGVRQQL